MNQNESWLDNRSASQFLLQVVVARTYHMISFHPDGSILSKVNLCLCTACLQGNLLNCLIEKGNLHCGESDEYGNDETEYDDDEFGDEIIDDSAERYELRSDCILQVIKKGCVVALFSPTNALELFYLCKVRDFGFATKDLTGENNHFIGEGSPYILTKAGHIIYELVPKPVYVYPVQIMSPNVNVSFIGSNIHLSCDEYQWLCDSI